MALIPAIGLKAQEKSAPAIDLEVRQASVANLETHIAQREQRLAERGRDIVELDTRIEKRVDELVKMLAGLPDSGKPGGGVTQLKQEVLQGLRRGIEAYATKRREVAELARTGTAAANNEFGKFDERIAKHVEQIADLTKSVPADKDAETYESGGGSYWNGYYYEHNLISNEPNQKRSDTKLSAKQAETTARDLRKSLERVDLRRRSLKKLLAKSGVTDAAKQLYTRELGRLAANEDHLQARLRDITVASLAEGKPVATDPAHDLSKLIEDSRRDLREDVARLFLCYDQFAADRNYVEYLKASLAARKDGLGENPPKEEPKGP